MNYQMECLTLDVILDYVRLMSYAVVFLSSLHHIFSRRVTTILLIGDVLMSASLICTIIGFRSFNLSQSVSVDYILTPFALIWAIIHYREMLHSYIKR